MSSGEKMPNCTRFTSDTGAVESLVTIEDILYRRDLLTPIEGWYSIGGVVDCVVDWFVECSKKDSGDN